jgi:hypothetical protein
MVLNSHYVRSSWNAVILGMVLKNVENRYVQVLLIFMLHKYKLLLRFMILLRHLIGHDSLLLILFIFLNSLIIGTLQLVNCRYIRFLSIIVLADCPCTIVRC